MKKIILGLATLAFIACGKTTKLGENASSINSAKEKLDDKFGKDAHYTSITITDTEHGSILAATVTENPSSLKMGDWAYFQNSWKQNSEITLELSEGSKAEDFMFQIKDGIVDFDLLGKLVEQSKEKVAKEKSIDVVTELISINAPNNGDFEKMRYFITTIPENGGTTFKFWYKMDGSLENFDY